MLQRMNARESAAMVSTPVEEPGSPLRRFSFRLLPREERFFEMFVEDGANVLVAARKLNELLRGLTRRVLHAWVLTIPGTAAIAAATLVVIRLASGPMVFVDRAAFLDTEPTDEPNEGFEGLAFRADASVPGGGVWYLTHQRLPAMVVELTFDPSAEAHPIGAESVVARWEIPGTDEVNGITYVATLNRLLVVGDRQDTLVVLGLGGQPLAQLDLPGDQQEGVAVDADGTLWIADDEGGSLLAFRDAVAVIEGALADAP